MRLQERHRGPWLADGSVLPAGALFRRGDVHCVMRSMTYVFP
ncbi:MAG: hypothetical protein ACC645_16525 [Pirellulales bacterium]